MGKTLIIAEKPSLAKNIVAAIPGTMKWNAYGNTKNSGYYENDQYIVSFAFGHLFTLFDAEDYDEEYKSWDDSILPIIPSNFEFKMKDDQGIHTQVKLLLSFIKSKDVDKIVNAGDSDREGEIIIRNIIRYSKTKKPVYRLWMPDQTPQTILAELKSMKKDSEYDSLANEGFARTYIDWLYGINLTRLASRKTGKLLRVGRVTSPIVGAICERERAIANFVPEKYYVAGHDVDGLVLTSDKRFKTSNECRELCGRYNTLDLVVKDKKRAKKTLPRPKLFALSDLQGVAGKQFKMGPLDTLNALQFLYEAGYVSYPRTNSQYMAEAEKDKAKDIIAALKKAFPTKCAGISFRDSKEIFDTSKVESHSGLTPTYKIPNLKELTDEQKHIYDAVVARFSAVFCTEEYVVDRTTLSIANGEENFTVTGNITVSKGYTAFEPASKKDEVLPPLEKGDKIKPQFKPLEKETVPPAHYSAATLNNYLKNPYSKDEQSDVVSEDKAAKEVISEVELGTEATRAGLIENAIKSGYITLYNNRYGITSLGEFYVDALTHLNIDMTKERTLELSKSLKQVYKGKMTVQEVVSSAEQDLKDICFQTKKIAPLKKDGSGAVLCKCPKCGGDIYTTTKAYSCRNKDCGIVIFKEDRFFERYGKKMNEKIAQALFTHGVVKIKGLVSPKSGKAFDAILHISFDKGKYPEYSMEFENK